MKYTFALSHRFVSYVDPPHFQHQLYPENWPSIKYDVSLLRRYFVGKSYDFFPPPISCTAVPITVDLSAEFFRLETDKWTWCLRGTVMLSWSGFFLIREGFVVEILKSVWESVPNCVLFLFALKRGSMKTSQWNINLVQWHEACLAFSVRP